MFGLKFSSALLIPRSKLESLNPESNPKPWDIAPQMGVIDGIIHH